MERKTEKVLGYDVDLLTFDEAISFVENKMSENEGMHIVTINPEIIEQGNKNYLFGLLIKKADLVVPDGVGIKIALKLKGIEQDQIPGIDLAKELLKSTVMFNKSVALIGAKEEVVKKTVSLLESEIKDINICYYRNGYFTLDKEKEILRELENLQPSLVLVALGAPKQDIFINKCREKLPNTIFIGVGGSFDVWAGFVERAPEFYRIMGLEWLYRTIKQPERLKRIYKTLPLFLFKAIIEAIKYKWTMCLKGKK